MTNNYKNNVAFGYTLEQVLGLPARVIHTEMLNLEDYEIEEYFELIIDGKAFKEDIDYIYVQFGNVELTPAFVLDHFQKHEPACSTVIAALEKMVLKERLSTSFVEQPSRKVKV